ncbi:MAG TPA: acyltransferase [Rhizomicrobium sp.]
MQDASGGRRNIGTSDVVPIQYLRGIAAMMVVFAHASGQFMFVTPALCDAGVSGVDLFFVISGFVMTYTAATHDYGWRQFLVRRVVRIVPFYYVMTIVTAALALALPMLFLTTRFTWDSFLASLLFVPYPAPGESVIAPILHLGWTLNFEMFFYVLFAALIWLAPWKRAGVLGAIFLGLFFCERLLHSTFAPLAFYGNPVTLEFAFGCVIGAAYVDGRFARIPAIVSISAAALALTLLTIGSIIDDPPGQRELWRGLPAAILVCAWLSADRTMPFRNAALHRLGDATYSIYLTHIFVVMALRRVWIVFHLNHSSIAIFAFVLLSMAFAAVIGIAVYERIETRLTRFAKRALVHRTPQPILEPVR